MRIKFLFGQKYYIVSLLKISKSSCKSLLASNPTLSEHFPKISKVTKIVSLSKVSLLKLIYMENIIGIIIPNTFHDFPKFVPAEVQNQYLFEIGRLLFLKTEELPYGLQNPFIQTRKVKFELSLKTNVHSW